MTYVDGFVLVVPKNKVAAYKKMAAEGGKMWMKHGALSYKECIGNDMNPNKGTPMETPTFPKMAKARSGETVWFSFITYRSRKHRDQVNAKVMKEMTEKMKGHENDKMPFDMKRMSYGGFEAIVDL